MVKRHNHLKIGWYHQHLAELLDLSLTPLEYMFREFPEARFRAFSVQRSAEAAPVASCWWNRYVGMSWLTVALWACKTHQ